MIQNEKQLTEETAKRRKTGTLTRGRAIHLYCLDCSGFNSTEVTHCQHIECPLWEFRKGNKTPLPIDE